MSLSSFSINGMDFVNYTECTEETLMDILSYRNSSEISRWMRDTAQISRSQHLSFVESLKASDARYYFAVFEERRYIGSIYLVKNKEGLWERGLYLLPIYQGIGLASKMEISFLKKISESGIRQVVAEVYKKNKASLRFHEKIGYRKIKENGESVLYTLCLEPDSKVSPNNEE